VESAARTIVRGVNLKRLNDVGLVITGDALRRASEAVSRMTADERNRAAGLYFVRDHAALWFLGDRAHYFS
jgi:hypothetical protein